MKYEIVSTVGKNKMSRSGKYGEMDTDEDFQEGKSATSVKIKMSLYALLWEFSFNNVA